MPENQVKKHALTPEMEAAKWKPGESGNPNGRPPKGQALADVMREYLDGEIEGQSGVKRKEAFVKAVYMRAMKGGDAAMKLIMNYIDGMPVQVNENYNKELPAEIIIEKDTTEPGAS